MESSTLYPPLIRGTRQVSGNDTVRLIRPEPIRPRPCARLGVIHSQVFSGFSGKATAERIVDSGSHMLITMDAYYRGGQLLDHKEKADVAVDEAKKEGMRVEKVLVWQRYPGRYSSRTPL